MVPWVRELEFLVVNFTLGGYYSNPPPQKQGLPILVGILAILIGIIGFVIVLLSLFVILFGLGLLGANWVYFSAPAGYVVIFGVIDFIVGIVMLAIARGLWDQESWALWTLGFVVVLELVEQILSYDVLLIVVFGFLLVYLVAVREHFS